MKNDRFVWRELEKKGFCNFVYIIHSFDFFFYGKKCAKYIPNLAYDITVYDITVYDITVYDITVYTRSWTMSETCMYCICTYVLNTIIPTSFLKIK